MVECECKSHIPQDFQKCSETLYSTFKGLGEMFGYIFTNMCLMSIVGRATMSSVGDTSLRSRTVSELIRHDGAARGSCQLRHSGALQRGISDLFLSE